MNILRISCSPRGQEAESHRLSQRIVEGLFERSPNARLMDRMIGQDPVAHIDADIALAQHQGDAGRSGHASLLRSEALIREVEAADILVIATPMHNAGVPSVLKAWIDHVVRSGRTFTVGPEGKTGSLRDRPVLVAVSSGGRYSGERARQPDFLTPYLTAILGMVGLRDLHFFSVQGTGLGEQVVALARIQAEHGIRAYFSSLPERHPVPGALA
ncbi:FMN-dependent NADH-azoreductase [Massilia niastensis]|uniref:FMN-dependent NADH-azoreductase n=1 Tax=Massilia niastensis TaxID=544911 RepID=UPI00037C84CA|nr:NAD(P)H-dependent oxidoreductase [Massilia niastensis]